MTHYKRKKSMAKFFLILFSRIQFIFEKTEKVKLMKIVEDKPLLHYFLSRQIKLPINYLKSKILKLPKQNAHSNFTLQKWRCVLNSTDLTVMFIFWNSYFYITLNRLRGNIWNQIQQNNEPGTIFRQAA